jgi:hypothetical protein
MAIAQPSVSQPITGTTTTQNGLVQPKLQSQPYSAVSTEVEASEGLSLVSDIAKNNSEKELSRARTAVSQICRQAFQDIWDLFHMLKSLHSLEPGE